ncbi:xanthine dehydrogenase family protein molybdopterin-binding subunit [Methylobacterium frigidaeris]|uniref:Nicotinate dehydrogenase subunit B n=1 Tax=Methylobacterium frigidaeris TaxID=2038277 RepID=A0AA37M4K9_9HYPH|nr:molybdopterin cofactor-binding domain-containing protein [Methylobacterium frigidaeris]PIK68759.1 aldehyde dehydrogenase [Methylobacterium frigidaeris]GJD62214.1 Nicotinate dehydrogenase subunit B [Methylobacterium frigidaeris]
MTALTRRTLLVGGALLVGIGLPREPKAASLPGGLAQAPRIDAWIRIGEDGAVTVLTGKAELGQGIKTALIQVAAEELGMAPAALRLLTADTELTPDEGYTAGSHSMQDSATAIRHAAAAARALLVAAAGRRLGLPPDSLRVESGAVVGPDGRRLALSEIAGAVELDAPVPDNVALRDPAAYTIVGRPLPRVDIPAKVAGGAAYVQDIRAPGMVHARIVRPPRPGARLVDLDADAVASRPGVIRVHRDGDVLAVLAEREYAAVTAMRALARVAVWQGGTPVPEPDALFADLAGRPAKRTIIHEAGAGTPLPPGRRITARYRRRYQMHGAIGPSCAVAEFDGSRLTVWSHAQGMFPLRKALAEMLSLPEEQVRCIHVEGSGCYGHNGADDAAGDAALLARALPGRPVRVQYTREQEHLWEPYGGAMLTEASAVLGPDGRIADWDYAVRSPTHLTRPPGAGQLLSARMLATPFPAPPPKALPQPEGGGDRNAIPLYRLPRARVAHDFVADMPLRVSALRSLGAYMNVFSIESFLDELAETAGADPVAFRLAHLDDPRARAVVEAAAERFGWGRPLQRGRGAGFAFARYKNLAAYCAVAVEVEVARESGQVRLVRAQAAVDAGQVVNPHGIRDQIEGGIIQAMSWSLFEAVAHDAEGPTSRDWSTYPIARFPDIPEHIAVHLIDRSGHPFLGAGEVAQGPTAAALANAIRHAAGVRLRELPMRPELVKAAIGV